MCALLNWAETYWSKIVKWVSKVTFNWRLKEAPLLSKDPFLEWLHGRSAAKQDKTALRLVEPERTYHWENKARDECKPMIKIKRYLCLDFNRFKQHQQLWAAHRIYRPALAFTDQSGMLDTDGKMQKRIRSFSSVLMHPLAKQHKKVKAVERLTAYSHSTPPCCCATVWNINRCNTLF